MTEALLPSNLDIFAEAINKERVVAYPTEAVFGLGCDPQNLQTVQRICKLKNRCLDFGVNSYSVRYPSDLAIRRYG